MAENGAQLFDKRASPTKRTHTHALRRATAMTSAVICMHACTFEARELPNRTLRAEMRLKMERLKSPLCTRRKN